MARQPHIGWRSAAVWLLLAPASAAAAIGLLYWLLAA